MMSVFTVPNMIVFAVTIVTVVLMIVLHYEVLNGLYRFLPTFSNSRRPRMVLLVGGIIVAHIVEIWLFGLVYWWLLQDHSLGAMTGVVAVDLFDCIYFSATTYTTAGYGDVVLTGAIRMLAGMEALAGLVMITWSASFTITEMRREWKD